MSQPFNYGIQLPQVMSGAVGGVQTALQIAQGMEAADAEKARASLYRAQTENAEAELAAKKRAAEQAAVLQQDVNNVLRQPTTEGINGLMLKYPHLSEGFQRGLSALNADEQKARVQEGAQVYAAILNGQPELGAQILKDSATALREKGNRPQAETYERMAKLIELNPDGALTSVGMMLSTAMGPDKFQSTFKELEDQRRSRMTEKDVARKAGADADKAQSDAAIAAAKAQYAQSDAALEIQQKGWNITKIQEDIKIAKLNAQIAAAQVAASRELNQLKREELGMKIEDMKRARNKETREKAAEVESARFNVDNMLNTIERIKKNPNVNDVIGGIEGRLPAVSDDGTDAIALIETLGSQAFLSQIPNVKGMGQLSNAEGEKLQAALQNLGRVQSERQFNANLDEAARLLTKARSNISTRYGVPDTKPDTPAAPGARPPLASFER